MLTQERHGGLEFVSTSSARFDEAIEEIKTTLPEGNKECPSCDYEAATFRWGIKTYRTADADRIALVLCCPSCETRVDLDLSSVV